MPFVDLIEAQAPNA